MLPTRVATSNGQLNAGSNALTFGNTLTLNFTALPEAESYTLFSFGSHTGDFTGVNITGSIVGSLVLSSPDTWTGVIGEQSFTFSESTGTLSVAAIPEPTTFSVILGVTACAGALRRRR